MRTRARAIHRPGVMNKTEAAYGFYLSDLQNKGAIREFKFESVKLILGKRCSYTPDFMVVLPDGTLEFHEVKGFWRDDARVKIKAAADKFPCVFLAVKQTKTGWEIEVIQEGEQINESRP